MPNELLDSFEDISGWSAIASGQARLDISQELGSRGNALRLDFDFHGGGGFVVARKLFALTLPESYSFRFYIRGIAPSNIFEFKLVDALNQNVWRYRVEAFDFPADWQLVEIKSNRIEFAWGPLGGGPAHEIAAIELVVAAGPGGRGTVWIEDLHIEDTTYRLTPRVLASSALPDYEPQHIFDPSTAAGWHSDSAATQWLLIDFQQAREYGGLVIHWEKDLRPRAFAIQISNDSAQWQTVYSTHQAGSERNYIYLPQTVSRYLRLELQQSLEGRGFGIVGIEIRPYDFSRSINAYFQAIAKEQAPGFYPKYLLGRQTYWTPVGTGEDVTQALFNEEGMVEVDKGTFSIEPFLYIDGRLITWADVNLKQELEEDYLPIPSSEWRREDLVLRITAFASGDSGASVLYLRYRLENRADKSRQVRFFAAIRPFQVTPTWQHWQAFGGVSRIEELSYSIEGVRVNRNKLIIPLTAPNRFGAAAFAQGTITEYLSGGEPPPDTHINDDFGYASGVLRYDLEFAPHSIQEIYLAIPFGSAELQESAMNAPLPSQVAGAEQFANAVRQWKTKLDAVDIRLPPKAQSVVDTLKTAAAHILINRAGPALHPGPRRYSRSWIRDGALMAAALLRIGCTGAGRDFIRWYAGYQTEDGNLPDCADSDGTEWLPEYDCWGEFIFAIMDTYRFTGDRAFVADMWPAILKSVDYMEALWNQRLTPEYRTPEKQACYGLLPESMSHEGYMAHPVHAYWDDFWALRGLKDATALALILDDRTQARRLATLRDNFRNTLYASLDTVIRERRLDYIPGSVELADFDPAATAIAITVADELHNLPPTAVDAMFAKYLIGFRERARGEIPWNNYSAYEIRIIGALVRLGQRESARELLEFFLADRRIPPWNQWPEISWRDSRGPSFIGDMPHSWIGAEYILSIRSLFAYERESDRSLVVAAGIAEDWLDDTAEVVVEDLPTYYGKLSYTLRREGPATLRLTLAGALTLPEGGIVIKPPLPGPLVQVEVNGRKIETFTADSATCNEYPAEIVMTGSIPMADGS
ncbi:MAG: discoidin domain-containing protein [Candidatus Competibacteraceae bacterium]